MFKKTLFSLCLLLSLCSVGYSQDSNTRADARMHYELGNIFYQEGRYEEAEKEYQRAIDILKAVEAPQPEVKPAVKKNVPPKKPDAAVPVKEKNLSQSEYTVGEDDILKISVWQNPDLDQEVIVRPDGMISFPLIGDVPVRGMTITEVDQEITRRLSEFVKSPEVSISLKKMGGSKVIVLGEITRPGIYSVTGSKTVLEAIGLAGGFTRDAVASSIVLIRGGFTQPHPQRLNLSKALKGREVQRQNIVLQAEDVIFVPKKFIADLNYFLNQVIDPLAKGAYTRDQFRSW